MRILVVGLIALALLAAGGAAFLAKNFLDSQRQTAQVASPERPPEVQGKQVLVASRDLPAGSVIDSGAIKWQTWPNEGIDSDFTSSTTRDAKLQEKFVGMVVRRGLVAGTPLTQKMVFKRERPGFLAGALDPGKRAVTVAVTPTSGLSGFLLPGDFVDVVLTLDLANPPNLSDAEEKSLRSVMFNRSAETVLKHIRVLAIDQKFNDFDEKPEVPKTVTLEVTEKQSEVLSLAGSMGKISLALRGLGGAGDEEPETYTSDFDVSPTLRAIFKDAEQQKKSASAKATRKSTGSNPANSVKVWRGGESTTQEFRK
jgi:pilus assembly protein CpaB